MLSYPMSNPASVWLMLVMLNIPLNTDATNVTKHLILHIVISEK